MKTFKATVKTFAQHNGISIVFRQSSVLYHKQPSDITANVLEALNKESKAHK